MSVLQRHLQILPPSGGNLSYRVELPREGNPCNGVWLNVASEWEISLLRSYVVRVAIVVTPPPFQEAPRGIAVRVKPDISC